MALKSQPPRARSIARIAAFLGRYGNQPWDVVKRMPMSFAYDLMDELSEMLKSERPSE